MTEKAAIEGLFSLPRIFTIVPGADPIALTAYYPRFKNYYPTCELQTKRWSVRNIQPEWHIFDVGANIGYYSILFGRCAAAGRVMAFEPTETIRLAERNLAANAVDNVQLVPTALGATAGTRDEAIFRIWGDPAEHKRYQFSTVDNEMARANWPRLDLIKIDVDSFDLEVLKGAGRTLDKFNPYVLVELNQGLAERNETVGSALDWLAGQGYADAIVLDRENFLLKRNADGSLVSRACINVYFDHEPVYLLDEAEALEASAANVSESPTRTDYGVLSPGGSRVSVVGPAWSYAALWTAEPLASGLAVAEMRVKVSDADIGIICTDRGLSQVLGTEAFISPGDETIVRISIPEVERLAAIVIRKGPRIGGTAEVSFDAPKVWQARPRQGSTPPLSLDPAMSSVEVERIAEIFPGRFPNLSSARLDIVESHLLGERLGFPGVFRPPSATIDVPLTRFRMQTHDAVILRQLYRAFRPMRHLEFGTCEGFGTRLCAENCEARIWTINLPHGERDESGAPSYADATGVTDAGSRIGRLYREACYGERVVQILAGSRDYDWSRFEPGFFDTILIDGGHSKECVSSDTEVALRLVRPAGLVIWHDFCPDPEVLRERSAARGVAKAILANWAQLRLHLSDIFWVRPSWLLIGVRNERLAT